MKKPYYSLSALLILIVTALACSFSFGSGTEQPNPQNEVATVVAATLQALTPAANNSESSTSIPTGMLPHTLYT